MMRLIDREPLMEYFEGLARSLANARCFNAMMRRAEREIDRLERAAKKRMEDAT